MVFCSYQKVQLQESIKFVDIGLLQNRLDLHVNQQAISISKRDRRVLAQMVCDQRVAIWRWALCP